MDFLRPLLVLVPIWWMYAGYAMQPIAVRSFGALLAVALGFAGTRWGAQAALGAIAVLAIAVIAIERQLETRTV